jgi:hypothetical protein
MRMMSDDFANEDERIRGFLVKMDDAFCEAMLKAIEAGEEHAPTEICTAPGTLRPLVVLAN